MSIRNAKIYKIAAVTAFCLFSVATLAQALTYSDIYQAQTKGQVLGASTPARLQLASVGANYLGSATISLPGPTTAGNELIVAVGAGYAGNTFTVSDNANNTWHLAGFSSYSSGQLAAVFYAENIISNSSPQITITASYPDWWNATAVEYSGLATSGSLDAISTNVQNGTTSYASNPVTSTAANDLLFGVHQVFCPGSSFTPTAPFTVVTTNDSNATNPTLEVQDTIGVSAGNYTSQGTNNCGTSYGHNILAAFKAGSGSSPGAPTITSFTASPTSITSGQSSNLSWSTSGATSASISSVGSVSVSGSSNVNPTVTTTYTLTATNSSGSATANATVTVTGGGSDTIPPNLSAISSSGLTSSSASITWTTDENSDSQVDYGLTNSYGSSSALNSSLTTSHNTSLSSLSASTLYHYRVKSKDSSGNLAVSADQSFTTSASSGGGGGITWTKMAHTSLWPSNSAWMNNIFDPVSQQMYLYGSIPNPSTIYSSDVYFYNSSNNIWTHLGGNGSLSDTASCATPDTATWPGDRHPLSQMVLDTKRNVIWIYGGICQGAARSDMYYLTLNSNPLSDVWTKATPAHLPIGLNDSAIAYDSDDDVLFNFGYDGGSGSHANYVYCPTSGTGVLSAAQSAAGCTTHDDWNEVSVVGGVQPPGYTFPGLIYDTTTHRVIEFGGETGGGIPQNQTWSYNIPTHTWTQKALSSSAPPPSGIEGQPAMAYNNINHLVYYHQSSGTGSPADWQYDPVADTWTKLTTSGGGSVGNGNLVYDSKNNLLVSWSGPLGAEDIWQGTLGANIPADTISPSTPTNLVATPSSSSQINLSWTASTDNVAVTGYNIYRNGLLVGTSATASFSDSSLTANTLYTYNVSAFDAANNISAQSTAQSATTLSGSVSSAGAHIALGCTTAYYIDKDCDGYGVGKRADGIYKLGLPSQSTGNYDTTGDLPDADDSDPTVNTVASWQAKWGINNSGMASFLQQKKGFANTGQIYYVSQTGNNATAVVNDPTHPYRTISPILTILHSNYGTGINEGGAIVVRGGNWTDLDFGACDVVATPPNNPCYSLTGRAAFPVYVMNYPGERVFMQTGLGGGGTVYWPALLEGWVTYDGFIQMAATYPLGDLWAFNNSSNITFLNMEVVGGHQTFFGNDMRNIVVEDNVFHNMDTHAVYFGSSGMTSYGAADFNFTQDAQNFINGTSPGASYNLSVLRNVMYNNGDSGYEPIHVNTYVDGVTIDSNIVSYSGGTGIGIQSGVYHATISNNVIFDNGTCGITFSLYGPDTQAATLNWNTITNNTIWMGKYTDTIRRTQPACGIEFADNGDVPHSIKNTTVENNVIVTDYFDSGYGNFPLVFMRDSYPNTDIFHNNVFYSDHVGNPVPSPSNFVAIIYPTAYPSGQDAGSYSFSQFQAYSPNFTGNYYADPMFTAASQNYLLTPEQFNLSPQNSSSPLIGAGMSAGAPTNDVRGNARPNPPSVGAYEFNGTVTPGVPIISSFTSSPSTITSGGSSTLSWSVSGATSLSIDQSIGTVTGNSKSVSPTLTTTYTLTATNSSGSVTAQATVTVSVPQPPVISSLVGSSITATTTTISWITDHSADTQVDYGLTNSYGQSSTLTDTSPLATNHTVTLSNLSPSTLYHFRAKSKDSNNLQTTTGDFTFTTLSLPLPPAPSISSFTPNPSSITLGQSSLLSFTVTGSTTSLSLNQGIGSVLGQNSKSISPIVSTTYTLTAQGPGGTATAQVTVTVGTTTGPTTTAPTILSFTINPSSIILGQTVTLNFQATGTPTPTLSIDNSIGTVLGLTKTITPSTTTTYTLTAVNSAGTATAQATVNVTAAPTGGGGSGGSSGGTSGGAGGSGTTNTTVPTVNPDGSITFIPKAITPTSTPSSALRLINSNGTFYLIKNNLRYGITSPGILYSYGFEFKDAKTATQQDLSIPLGTLLLPGNGYLVKSAKDKTVYLISNNQRYAFTSAVVFTSLGFSFTHVFLVTDPELQSLPQAQNISDPNSKHLPGLDINRNGTIYWVGTDNLLHGYPNLSVYNSWHRDNDFSQVVTANAADLSLPVGGLVIIRILQ